MTSQEKLKQEFEDIAKRIEPILKEVLTKNVDKEFHQMVTHQVSTGGKRLRPGLALVCCQMLGGKIKDVIYPATGLEILHTYTLIIDDIIDHSIVRRNKPTVWKKFGKSIAKCVAMSLSASIFETVNHSSKPAEISNLLAQALKTIINGEILDLLLERSGREDEPYIVENRKKDVSHEQYFEMIAKKTASLIEASCLVGGICAGANQKQLKALKEYGFNLGMAFQIQDDILDIFGDQKKLGKKVGGDIEERKGGNIVILYANSQKLQDILKQEQISTQDIEKAVNLISQTKAREKAENLAKRYIDKAQKNLKLLPQNKENQILLTISDFIITRDK